MAKKQMSASDAPVSVLDMMLTESKKTFKNVTTASQLASKRYGIEPYSLAFQWLIHCNVLPMGNVIAFAGPPKSYKTSALLELGRWFAAVQPGGGLCRILDTEGKLSPTKVASLVGPELEDRCPIQPCSSVNGYDKNDTDAWGWQPVASDYLTKTNELHDKISEARKSRTGDGKYKNAYMPPQFLMIDSLNGAQDESMHERMEKEGTGGQVFDQRPKLNTQWLSTWSSKIAGRPVTIGITQHLKDGIGGMPGVPNKVTSGGVALGFHCSLQIYVTKTNKTPEIKNGAEVTNLQWQVNFSSIGLDNRKIIIPYHEGWDENDNQRAWFDWDTALVELILRLQEDQMFKVQDLIDLTPFSAGIYGKLVKSKALKIDEERAKEEGWTYSKVGQFLQTDPTWRQLLQKAMRIQNFKHWYPNVEFGAESPLPAQDNVAAGGDTMIEG